MNTRYLDRADAGRRLAEAVWQACPEPAVVAGIPRGGMAVALPVAERLGAPLVVVLIHKLTVQAAPELAIGAIDEDSHTVLSVDTVGALHAGSLEVTRARERAVATLELQRGRYPTLALADFLPERTLVLVDDGLATGLTARVAVAYARRHGALRVIVAAPCASLEAAHLLQAQTDAFICPIVDPDFFAVQEYYEDFAPVRDAEIVRLLERASHDAQDRPDAG